MYADRADAGRILARELERFRDQNPVIVALPRGGVVVGFEVARALDAPLEVLVVRKIGAQYQPELAVGAVAEVGGSGDAPLVLVGDAANRVSVAGDYFQAEAARQIDELRRRQALYRAGRPAADLHDRTVILVDDGIATGATTLAALRVLRRSGPARLVLAVPVAPPRALEALRMEADEVICPLAPGDFGAVGEFYSDFRQTDDAEVIALLERARGLTHETGVGGV
jgi:putative phosphoribosyl transferase